VKNKFLSEEEYQEFLSEQHHYYETVPLKNIAYDLLSKYGFNDGDDILSEIRCFAKTFAIKNGGEKVQYLTFSFPLSPLSSSIFIF
jgi:hypothetical protein